MTERFPRYIQIYEPFTLKDNSNNSLTFEPNGTPSNFLNNNVRTKVVNLNSYDFKDFTSELQSVFGLSFDVKDDQLLTRHNFLHILSTNYGINYSTDVTDVSNVRIIFNNYYDQSNNASFVNTNSSLHVQSDKTITFSTNNTDLSTNKLDAILDNSGFFGLGTSNPVCPLHIHKSNNNSQTLKTQNSNYSLTFSNNTINDSLNNIIDNSENSIVFSANGIDSTSNALSICPHSSSSNGIKIDHSGNLISFGNFSLKDNNNNKLWYFDIFNTNNDLRVSNNSLTYSPLTISTLSGDIGIGTNNPLSRLHIFGNTNKTSLILGENIQNDKSVFIDYLPSNSGSISNLILKHSGDTNSSAISFNKGGDVGLGLTDPSSNLHIYGDNNKTELLLGQEKSDNRSSVIDYTQGSDSTDGSIYIGHFSNNKDKGVNIKYNGFVGIGKKVPDYPLHIIGQGLQSGAGTTAFSQGDSSISTKSTTFGISIFAGNAIYGSTIGVHSDIRIKNNIEKLIPNNSIKLLRKIKPVSFNYIDNWNHGNDKMFGFIAQDVKKIIPEASSIVSSVVPNIYEYAHFDDTHKIIYLKDKITSCFNNEMPVIDIYNKLGNKDTVKCTKIIDETTFEIENTSILFEDNDVFVYGEHITDFHVFKPEIVNTITTSAVQELDEKLTNAKKNIKEQDNRISILEELVRNLTTRIFKLEQDKKTM